MAALKAHKSVGAGFGNGVDYHRIRYDFTKDAGAQSALDIMTASADLIVVYAALKVVTAGTSGGSATLIWGDTDDTNRFCTTTQGAVASLTLANVILPLAIEGTPNGLVLPFLMASGKKLIQTIGTADLTAGVFEYVIGVMKP